MVTDIKAWLPHNLYEIVKKPLSFHILACLGQSWRDQGGEPLIQKQASNHIIANNTIWKIWRNNVLFLILNRKNQLLIDEAEERKAPPYKNKLPIILKPTTESGKSKETISYVLYSQEIVSYMYCILILILEQYSTDV